MNNMPWMFHFEDADEAEAVARELFRLGGVVIADPNHLPDNLMNMLVSVSRVADDGTVKATIHEVDWTVELDWHASEPKVTAGNLFCLLNSPGEMFDSLDTLPEGTPMRVIAWLDLDDEDED
jgi:hypothetical protein